MTVICMQPKLCIHDSENWNGKKYIHVSQNLEKLYLRSEPAVQIQIRKCGLIWKLDGLLQMLEF